MFDYVEVLCNSGKMKAYFARKDYMNFVEYPTEGKEYNSPLDVLIEEVMLGNSDAGAIYIHRDGIFTEIAYYDNRKKESRENKDICDLSEWKTKKLKHLFTINKYNKNKCFSTIYNVYSIYY